MRQGQGERMKKSQEKHVTVVYTISKACHRSIYDFCCEKSLLFPPENLKTLIKVYGFPVFFRLFPPCYIGIYSADASAVLRGKRVSTPAINLLNENPSLVALGKKSQEKHVTVVYTISRSARVPPTIFCCEKSLLFPPENLKTLIKVCGFPIFFRLLPP